MIFVTVGSMLPFERLVQEMDRWSAEHPQEEVYAQIGSGVYEPRSMRWTRRLNTKEFEAAITRASLIVAHAGTGSFFLAAQMCKPVVLLPRRAEYREATTNHQIDTAVWLRSKPGIFVAMTDEALPESIREAQEQGVGTAGIDPFAPKPFLDRLREFLVA